MDATKTFYHGLVLLAPVGAAALEVTDILQREVEWRILDEADEPKSEAKAEPALGHEILQLHPVLPPSECKEALGQERIVS